LFENYNDVVGIEDLCKMLCVGRNTAYKLIMDKNLDVFEFRILAYLVSRSDSNNFCFPSYTTIEKDLKIIRSKAISGVKKLIELGYISVENRILGNDRQTSNGYIISVFENPEGRGNSWNANRQDVKNDV